VFHDYDHNEALEDAWQRLQESMVFISKVFPIAKHVVWPGPNAEGTAPTFGQISATACWIQDKMPTFEDNIQSMFVLVYNCTARLLTLLSAKEPVYKIYDDKTGRSVVMTSAMMLDARMNPGAHPGCIEAGRELAVRIFNNRVSMKVTSYKIDHLTHCS